MDELLIGTCHVQSFFNKDSRVEVPDYQRPYVWDTVKIDQLLQDLEEHFINTDNNLVDENTHDYYLGTILLHQKEDLFDIIDGQQRITTLLLIDHAWNKEKSILSREKWNLSYTSSISQKSIKNNFEYLLTKHSVLKPLIQQIFKRLIITCIITQSEDEAFSFFDSQNNRGVTLSPIDFLKSYHLRELKGNENLQAVFAKKWDFNNKEQFLDMLFNQVLWRNRNWKGKSFEYENKELILDTFQKNCIKKSDNEVIRLYPNAFNKLSENLLFDEKKGVKILQSSIWLNTEEMDYPFSIRQPIQKGIGFFLFTEKYSSVFTYLFEKQKFIELDEFYSIVYDGMNRYMKSFFKLSVVSFYDKFKGDRLLEFCMWFDYMLGSYRVFQKAIVANTIIKILRDSQQNLLDVIEMAYEPEEVFRFLKSSTNNEYYNNIKDYETGIRNHYFINNRDYYDQKEDALFSNKKEWINAKIKVSINAGITKK